MHVGIANPRCTGKTFPAFPAHAQPAILRILQEAHETSLHLLKFYEYRFNLKIRKKLKHEPNSINLDSMRKSHEDTRKQHSLWHQSLRPIPVVYNWFSFRCEKMLIHQTVKHLETENIWKIPHLCNWYGICWWPFALSADVWGKFLSNCIARYRNWYQYSGHCCLINDMWSSPQASPSGCG